MGLFDYFRNSNKNSASVAKDRLKIIVAQERAQRDSKTPDYLPLMKKEILQVINKYVQVGDQDVQINLEREDDCEILELNVILPEHRD